MDILINNAGICVLEDFMDISSDSFDEVIAINTRAPLLVSQVLCVARLFETRNVRSCGASAMMGTTRYSICRAICKGQLNQKGF